MAPRSGMSRWVLTPFGARAAGLIAIIAVLGVIAGVAVVSQVTDQMRRDADARLASHTSDEGRVLEETMASASSDIRLARRNQIFESALADTRGQLLPTDRQEVETAITYLGDRYKVDEIFSINVRLRRVSQDI